MANEIAIFRINYKSDFILTLNSDAGWMTPFCIKFWTGAPSQAYFVGYDGTTYTHCAPVGGEPTKLRVQFDDHHLPVGELKFQIGYHFTVADFPNDTEDEVLNQERVVIEIDGHNEKVMLDFNGETAPDIQFSLPAYANEAKRIANEEQRIAHEAIRIANEESRIAAETTRQQNEAQRIDQETARVQEFARLKRESESATSDATAAATLANEKAQLAADKAALAQAAADLANAKAQLAADKAALAASAAQLANDKAALAQQKAEYAQTQGDYAKGQGDYAKEQGEIAEEDHERAEADHTRAESDHTTADDDHETAASDHSRAESDHSTASADHTTSTNDHTQAVTDHSNATSDHAQAGSDHTRAESDHTRAESDHAAVEVYVDSLGAFDISAYNATGGVLAKYADLSAALGTDGANIPEAIRKGGMSVKFVQSSDNKYVQYRLMKTAWSNVVGDWQGVDSEPTAGSRNLVESGGIDRAIQLKKSIVIKGIIYSNHLFKINNDYTFSKNDIAYNVDNQTIRILKEVYYDSNLGIYRYVSEELTPDPNVIYCIGRRRLRNVYGTFSLIDYVVNIKTIDSISTMATIPVDEFFFNNIPSRALNLKVVSDGIIQISLPVTVSHNTVFIDYNGVIHLWNGTSDIRTYKSLAYTDIRDTDFEVSESDTNATWDYGFYDLRISIGSVVGPLQEATATKYVRIPVAQGEAYLVKTQGSSERAISIGIVDADNRLIYKDTRYGILLKRICCIPEGGAYMIVHNAVDEANPFVVKRADLSELANTILSFVNQQLSELDESLDHVIGSINTTEEYSEADALSSFTVVASGKTKILYDAVDSIGKNISAVTKANTTKNGYVLKIPVTGCSYIEYPAFSSSSGYGCVVTDDNDIVIAQFSNSSGSLITKHLNLPEGSAYFYFSSGTSLKDSDYTIVLGTSSINALKNYVDKSIDRMENSCITQATVRWLPYISNIDSFTKNSLCLAAIQFEYEDNKMPFQRGYLFHKFDDSTDKKVFYGTQLDNAIEVGTLDYSPSACVVGVSPKDGTIVSVFRDARQAIRVYNGENHTVDAKSSDGTNTSPKGWLYNSGCEFVPDGNDEYCIFAEYDGSVSDNQRLYIWKGTYPYTSAANWKTVYYKTTSYNSGSPTPGSITHWHMIRRDPWSGVIYCTSGDFTGQFFWIYSTDNGETWNELASDSNDGTKPSWVLDGQPLRCINFIFTKEYIYFATDHGSNNTLSRIKRDTNTGVIDITTREVLADLPYGVAINSLCYIESPNGLFMFTRTDTGFSSEYAKPVPVLFWSFKLEKLIEVATLKKTSNTWGGHRGKCYFNYTNGQEPRPAMGFAGNTPCGFDLIGASDKVGTIFYEL